MLIDVKSRLNESALQELVGYAVFPDAEPERLDKALQAYRTDAQLHMYGYESEGEVIGIVGFREQTAGVLELLHVAVIPEERGKEYGRGQLLELLELRRPVRMEAIAEEDTVDFFRNVGFEIASLGERQPGFESFKCTYWAELEEEAEEE